MSINAGIFYDPTRQSLSKRWQDSFFLYLFIYLFSALYVDDGVCQPKTKENSTINQQFRFQQLETFTWM